jgi:uncharacterized Zn finger protein
MPRAHRWRKDGEWFYVPIKGTLLRACCGCGLVHRERARITKDRRVQLVTHRDARATRAAQAVLARGR